MDNTTVQALLRLAAQVLRLSQMKSAYPWGASAPIHVCLVVIGFACSDFLRVTGCLCIHMYIFTYVSSICRSFEGRKPICYFIYTSLRYLLKSFAYHRSSVNIIDSFPNCWSPLHFFSSVCFILVPWYCYLPNKLKTPFFSEYMSTDREDWTWRSVMYYNVPTAFVINTF